MVTKTEYRYICSIGSGKAVNAILLSNDLGLRLHEGPDSRPFDTIGDVEKYLCDKYQEVTLDTKTNYSIIKMEKTIQ